MQKGHDIADILLMMALNTNQYTIISDIWGYISSMSLWRYY